MNVLQVFANPHLPDAYTRSDVAAPLANCPIPAPTGKNQMLIEASNQEKPRCVISMLSMQPVSFGFPSKK
jgi:hypothetical protein